MITQVSKKTNVTVHLLIAAVLMAALAGCENKYAYVARGTETPNKIIAPSGDSQTPQGPNNPESVSLSDGTAQALFTSTLAPSAEAVQWVNAYHIGKGDVLDVAIYQLVELDKETKLQVTVDSQGRIFLPVIGSVTAADLTLDQLREQLTQRLQQNYLKDPRVSLSIFKYNSKQVLVIGAVRRAGIVYLEKDAAYLQDVLSKSEGLITQHGEKIEIVRGAHQLLVKQAGGELTDAMLTSAKKSGQYDVATIPISVLYSSNPAGNPLIYPGDLVHVLMESNGCYYIAGAVRSPGARNLRNSMTVLQAVVSAGDTKFEASDKDCRIIRTLPDGQEQLIYVDLDKVRSGEQENLVIARNDMIVVPKDPLKSFISGIGSILRTGAQVGVDYTYDASPVPANQTTY